MNDIMLVALTVGLIILLLFFAKLYLVLQIYKELTKRRIERYNAAIDFAATLSGLEANAFLKAWCDGDWHTIKNELPLFDVKEDIRLNSDLIEYGIKYGH